jgi:hypothetical protein
MLDPPYTRQDCHRWLKENYPKRTIPRSSCIGCPFHSDKEWRQLKDNPETWKDATEFDEAIRNCGGMRGQMFLHRSGKPLKDVDLRTQEEAGQESMWNEECGGYCAT